MPSPKVLSLSLSCFSPFSRRTFPRLNCPLSLFLACSLKGCARVHLAIRHAFAHPWAIILSSYTSRSFSFAPYTSSSSSPQPLRRERKVRYIIRERTRVRESGRERVTNLIGFYFGEHAGSLRARLIDTVI